MKGKLIIMQSTLIFMMTNARVSSYLESYGTVESKTTKAGVDYSILTKIQ